MPSPRDDAAYDRMLEETEHLRCSICSVMLTEDDEYDEFCNECIENYCSECGGSFVYCDCEEE